MSTAPKISVGLPVYNGADLIKSAIESVLSQDIDGLELIVADNCSTDHTLDIAQDMAGRDQRLRILTADSNGGAAWNYNRVFDASAAKYFCWHAHDDILYPGALQANLDALAADPGAVLAHSWSHFLDDEGSIYRDYEDDLGVTSDKPHERLGSIVDKLTYCTSVFGVVERERLGQTPLIASFPGSDVTLLYELALMGRFAVIEDFMCARRPGNSTQKRTNREVAEWFGPKSSGARFRAAIHAKATMGAIRRTVPGAADQARCVATFGRVWPLNYARRWKHRNRRLRNQR